MSQVRIKLDFVIEWEGEGIPRELVMLRNINAFIAAGLDEVGVVGNGKSVTLLPGARVEVKVARARKRVAPCE